MAGKGNPENLRPPWKPGESGNPKGRPKGRSITDRLRQIVEQDDGKVADALAKAATKAALKGDFRFWQEILNRLEGAVPVKQITASFDPASMSEEELDAFIQEAEHALGDGSAPRTPDGGTSAPEGPAGD